MRQVICNSPAHEKHQHLVGPISYLRYSLLVPSVQRHFLSSIRLFISFQHTDPTTLSGILRAWWPSVKNL